MRFFLSFREIKISLKKKHTTKEEMKYLKKKFQVLPYLKEIKKNVYV